MTLKVSTGLRDAMLGTDSLSGSLALGIINIYSGTAPATADAAETGTLLVTITESSGATGLSLDVASGGTIAKDAAVWSGLVAATGTAGYWRFVTDVDSGDTSTTDIRLQGVAALSGSELVMTSIDLTASTTQTIDYFSLTLPE